MGLFNRKIKGTEKKIAKAFFSQFISNENFHPNLLIEMGADQREKYRRVCRADRMALIFVMLINEGQNNPKALSVRADLENLIFAQGNDKMEALLNQNRANMRNINELISSESTEGRVLWGESWLAKVGIENNDPSNLTVIVLFWIDLYNSAVEMFRKLEKT